MPPEDELVVFRRSVAGVSREAISDFAYLLRRRVARGVAFSCLISGDKELQRLNAQYRGKDYPADVLSFPAASAGRQHGLTLGDIAISARRAAVQARDYGHSTEDELRILMLHGVLHLMGYDHETDGGRMARAEARWRRTLGIPNGLIERAGR